VSAFEAAVLDGDIPLKMNGWIIILEVWMVQIIFLRKMG